MNSLFIYRPVVNQSDIQEWMKDQGFEHSVNDMHVTLSLDYHWDDWAILPRDFVPYINSNTWIDRKISILNGGAITIEFESLPLTARWSELLQCGVHQKWDIYRPHITISYILPQKNIKSIVPYDGPIVLGPEVFTSSNKELIKEKPLG